MKPYNSSMFDSIKNAIDKTKNKTGGSSAYRNILSLEANDKPYTVRLLPNIKNPEETILHYYHHGWKSVATGQYTGITSPSTWGDRCPVSELYFKIQRESSDADKERAKANLRRKENWFVNVYVVNDPVNPENNGTVKVLRYGKQLDKIIQSAINGDDAQEFGARIFDLSPEGCSLRIKVELVSDRPGATKFPTYTASKFLNASAIDGLDDDKIAEIYNNTFDLNAFIERKSSDEIKAFIDQHYYGSNAPAAASVVEEEEDVPYDTPAPKATAKPAAKVEATTANDDKVLDILNGLDNL